MLKVSFFQYCRYLLERITDIPVPGTYEQCLRYRHFAKSGSNPDPGSDQGYLRERKLLLIKKRHICLLTLYKGHSGSRRSSSPKENSSKAKSKALAGG
jgi:hypothetical protein